VDYTALAVAIAAAIFWYKGAAVENISPLVWVGLSLALSAVVMLLLHQGWLGVALAQVAMFVGIAVMRTVREKDPGSTE
jgi:hypothetical protein